MQQFFHLLVGSPASQWSTVAVFLILHLMKAEERMRWDKIVEANGDRQ